MNTSVKKVLFMIAYTFFSSCSSTGNEISLMVHCMEYYLCDPNALQPLRNTFLPSCTSNNMLMLFMTVTRSPKLTVFLFSILSECLICLLSQWKKVFLVPLLLLHWRTWQSSYLYNQNAPVKYYDPSWGPPLVFTSSLELACPGELLGWFLPWFWPKASTTLLLLERAWELYGDGIISHRQAGVYANSSRGREHD